MHNPQTDPLCLHYAQKRDREDEQLREREEKKRTLIAKKSKRLLDAAFYGESTTFGELLEKIIDEYPEEPAKFLFYYKPALIASLDNTIKSRPRADKRLLKEILTLMLDKDNASEADKRILEDINLGKALTDAVAQKKWWAVHTLLDINPHDCFSNMRNLDDLLTKVILEEHESQDAYKLEQTEQLDEATAAAGAAAAKPLQTQSLEQPGDSEQEAAVDPQERSECLIKIKDLLLEKYHVSPCKMITICLYDEKISEGEKLDLILDLLKLSIKEIKEPNELYLENLRLCVEHALDHKKIDLLRALLNSRDIYNCEDEAQEASAASASSDKKDIRSDMARIILRGIVTGDNFKDEAELLNEFREFDFCKFEYTIPSSGHTLLSLALIVNNQTAFNILANDQELVSKTLDNILDSKLILDKQIQKKFSIDLGKKAKVRSFNKSLKDKIRDLMFISESTSEQKDAFPRSLSSSSLMKSESGSEDSGAEDEVSGGAAAAMAPAEVHRPKAGSARVFHALPFSIFGGGQKPKPAKKEQPSEKKGSIFSKRKLTEDEQKKKDDRQFSAAMPNYDDL